MMVMPKAGPLMATGAVKLGKLDPKVMVLPLMLITYVVFKVLYYTVTLTVTVNILTSD